MYVRQDLVTTLSLTYVRVVGDLRPSGVGMLRNSLGLRGSLEGLRTSEVIVTKTG